MLSYLCYPCNRATSKFESRNYKAKLINSLSSNFVQAKYLATSTVVLAENMSLKYRDYKPLELLF